MVKLDKRNHSVKQTKSNENVLQVTNYNNFNYSLQFLIFNILMRCCTLLYAHIPQKFTMNNISRQLLKNSFSKIFRTYVTFVL